MFKNYASLSRHRIIHHSRGSYCTVCKVFLSDYANSVLHCKAKHGVKMPCCCSCCNWVWATYDDLVSHKRTMKYNCPGAKEPMIKNKLPPGSFRHEKIKGNGLGLHKCTYSDKPLSQPLLTEEQANEFRNIVDYCESTRPVIKFPVHVGDIKQFIREWYSKAISLGFVPVVQPDQGVEDVENEVIDIIN